MNGNSTRPGYVEIPYTLPQDFTLFVLMGEKNIDVWKRKLDWIVSKGGMVLMLLHPDYIHIGEGRCGPEEYHLRFHFQFLRYVRDPHQGMYYHVLPSDLATYRRKNIVFS